MIAVELEGRLGNQLFQYAFIYAVAKTNKQKFYLDKSTESLLIDKYFEIKPDKFYFFDKYIFSIKGFKNIFSFYLKKFFYKQMKHLFSLSEQYVEDGEQVPKNSENNILYKGYFQSERYFNDYKLEIKEQFSIKKNFRKNFSFIRNEQLKNLEYVAIHIRRTDYISTHFELPLSYYLSALKKFDPKKYLYVFISDDPDYVVENFAHLENKYVSRNSEIIDFQFLINADACILSNSSFSWWGAYLNHKNTEIIAPKYWMGHKDKKEIPQGIILHTWITLDF